jgi:hypothetical protein
MAWLRLAAQRMAGFTAMDVAVASRAALVLRRLEAAAPFSGVLAVKEVKWGGLGTAWQSRHCVVMHRYAKVQAMQAKF